MILGMMLLTGRDQVLGGGFGLGLGLGLGMVLEFGGYKEHVVAGPLMAKTRTFTKKPGLEHD